MSVATLRQIVCPSCGDSRDVSDRHQRRLDANPDADRRCDGCRNPREIEHGNTEILFWLEWAGIRLPEDASGMAYIRVFGLPPKLNQLLVELNGTVRYLP